MALRRKQKPERDSNQAIKQSTSKKKSKKTRDFLEYPCFFLSIGKDLSLALPLKESTFKVHLPCSGKRGNSGTRL